MKIKNLITKGEEMEGKIQGLNNAIINFAGDHADMKKTVKRLNKLHPTPAQDPYDPEMYRGLHKEPHENEKIKAMIREEIVSVVNTELNKRFQRMKENFEKNFPEVLKKHLKE